MIICEASYAQRREYMLYKLRDDHYPFNMQQHFTISNYSREKFKDFMAKVLKRHEILRTTLALQKNQLKQFIHDSNEFDFEFQHYSLLDKDETEQVAFVNKQKIVQKCMSFNMEVGPLFRIIVFSVSDQLDVVLVTGHHVLFDDHSFKIFNKELQNFFSPEKQIGQEREITQYRAFSDWEWKLINTSLGDTNRAYHNSQLSPGVPQFDLISLEKKTIHAAAYLETIKKVRKKMNSLGYADEHLIAPLARRIQSNDGGMVTIYWDHSVRDGLWGISTREKVSLTAVFIGWFLQTLTRLSGQELFVVDIPVSSRPGRKYQDTIGWMALQGLCFFEVERDASDKDIFIHVDERLFSLYENSVFPYECIGSTAVPPVGGDIPIFFNLSYMDGNLEDVAFNEQISVNYGLNCYQQMALFVYVYPNGISIDFCYNNSLFEPDQAQQIITEYQNMVLKSVLTLTI